MEGKQARCSPEMQAAPCKDDLLARADEGQLPHSHIPGRHLPCSQEVGGATCVQLHQDSLLGDAVKQRRQVAHGPISEAVLHCMGDLEQHQQQGALHQQEMIHVAKEPGCAWEASHVQEEAAVRMQQQSTIIWHMRHSSPTQ